MEVLMVFSGFWHEKTNPIKPNLCFTAENAEFAELLNNNVLSYFSAVFANSAVNLKKQACPERSRMEPICRPLAGNPKPK